jgi:hypothetical protein
MASLNDLASFCQTESKMLDDAASVLASKVAEAILNDFIMVSPVDTSRLVSNWILTVGLPAEEAIEPYVAGSKGSTRAESSSEALAQGLTALQAKVPGVPIYITNNVPYVRYINDGTPYIAAVGYIERALLIARNLGVDALGGLPSASVGKSKVSVREHIGKK